jgi:hypothetical protein
VTDGDTHPEQGAYLIFWRVVDEAIVGMGFASMWGKMKLPVSVESNKPFVRCVLVVTLRC